MGRRKARKNIDYEFDLRWRFSSGPKCSVSVRWKICSPGEMTNSCQIKTANPSIKTASKFSNPIYKLSSLWGTLYFSKGGKSGGKTGGTLYFPKGGRNGGKTGGMLHSAKGGKSGGKIGGMFFPHFLQLRFQKRTPFRIYDSFLGEKTGFNRG